MPSLAGLLRTLGNDRAVANVQAVLDARQREEWVTASLALRLDRNPAEAAPVRFSASGG